MALPAVARPSGSTEVNFFSNAEGHLDVTIETDRLHIRSVEATEKERDQYVGLFGNPEVMGKYATGETRTREAVEKRINDIWVKRWRKGDPYSGLTVFKDDEFLGHVVLGHSDTPGQSELAYLFNPQHWHKGYGTEAVTAVVKEYAPATVEKGYLLDGKPLERIVATARVDNPYSVRILEKVGMKRVGEEEKYGAKRHLYAMDLPKRV
ncbi:MAG TPA: GNAT family N-acetyltransferase [Chlamydiales bacterium]|nr:GNAT family N-acetyltransferase [Chlamydiales bacterium]